MPACYNNCQHLNRNTKSNFPGIFRFSGYRTKVSLADSFFSKMSDKIRFLSVLNIVH